MKKVLFVFLMASFTSLVAAASNEVLTNPAPGDPKKDPIKPPTFTLAQGYFSLFNLFSGSVADTAKVATPVVLAPQQPAEKKQ